MLQLVIADLLTSKYGKQFAEQALSASEGHKNSPKLMHKLAIQAPPKLLVENYLIEIAKMFNIAYEPDPQVMNEERKDGFLIDLSGGGKNNLGGNDGPGGSIPQPFGFVGYPQPPPLPQMPQMPDPPTAKPFNYGPPGFGGGGGGGYPAGSASAPPPFNYNIPPNPQQQPQNPEKKDLNINSNFLRVRTNF